MSNTGHNDDYFVEGLRNRSHTVFEALFRHYYPGVYRFAYSYLMNRHHAEDIVQDVFASLWRGAQSLPEGVNLQNYIYTAVKHACFDHLKHIRVVDSNKQKLVESLIFSGTVEYEEDPCLQEKITECMALLSDQQRQVLELKINQRLGYREIASRMNISEGTVHTHIKRAYQTIRKNLPALYILLRVWGVL